MLLINQCLDKLAATRFDFEAHGMLNISVTSQPLPTPGNVPHPVAQVDDADVEDDPGMTSLGDVHLAKSPARKYPKQLQLLAVFIHQPRLAEYIRQFLFDQFYPDSDIFGMDMGLVMCPVIDNYLRINVFHSAVSTFYAPSDLSGIGGMHCERIRATPSWKKGPAQFDCVFVETGTRDDDLLGFRGLHFARVLLFFSFYFDDILYPCALVQWFTTFGDSPAKILVFGWYSLMSNRDNRLHLLFTSTPFSVVLI
ncbi:hypothetical protein H0H81_002798 [Sphagnurus paluster]|uniref:Uncharacterized protein n=1 Tax=Sphagnurus paluster TaxID=117069 RepID=A0A9P7GHZ4_9AGAR|nr:hypothetical protein H0H81_002798 [Sphagnurus paluster]